MSEYSWSFGTKLQIELSNFPEDQQNKILFFAAKYEENGLSDFSKYDGKIAKSWSGVPEGDPAHEYAKANHLWHYHIGIPEYTVTHGKYKTSDMVLHFQWENRGNHINMVDVYYHYSNSGEFYLPPVAYLK